jgi:Mn2+/Fe2+ NRAMP family transporter
VLFITLSTIIFYFIGSPAKVLVVVGALNGLILPIALAILLIAATRRNIMGAQYHHPKWLFFTGWIVVAFMAYAGVKTILTLL